jgi:hypothetical protein
MQAYGMKVSELTYLVFVMQLSLDAVLIQYHKDDNNYTNTSMWVQSLKANSRAVP